MKFTNGAITPNVTAFGSPLGRKKRQKKSRGVVDRNPFWYEDAALGRIVTRIPWADTLSWLGYDSHRRWSYAVRADADFDVVAFLSPIGIGFVIMLIALVGGKYLQHPDLQGFFGGLSTVITITIAFSVAYAYNISFLQSSIGLVMGSLAIGFGVYRSIGPTKVSDGEILTAGVALGLMGLRASSSDPLTGRVIGYMIDVLLLTAACVVLPSGRRMGTSGILVRSTVLLFTGPFEHLTDETRAVPMTFLASLSSAMDIEFLAQDSPMSYLTFLGRIDVAAKFIMVVLSVLAYASEDPRRQLNMEQSPPIMEERFFLRSAMQLNLNTTLELGRKRFLRWFTSTVPCLI